MTTHPDPPPMRQTAGYQYHHHSPGPPYLQSAAAAPSPLPALAAANTRPDRQDSAPSPRRDQSRAHGSVSSGGSASTLQSEYRHMKSYQYSPDAERGHAGAHGARTSHPSTRSEPGFSSTGHTRSDMVEDNSTVFRYIQPEEEGREPENDHALWILIWMSFFDPFHCFFSAIYSILALVVIVVLLPLRLCRKECSPSISLVRLIAPIFRQHLQLIHGKSLQHAHTFEFSPSCLVLIHLVSPLLSLGNAVAAWVVAVFWIFTLVMGNPDGTEKRDDGRAAVLGLRDWWERWLLYAVRK